MVSMYVFHLRTLFRPAFVYSLIPLKKKKSKLDIRSVINGWFTGTYGIDFDGYNTIHIHTYIVGCLYGINMLDTKWRYY